jgi:aspartate/glutamate racemase
MVVQRQSGSATFEGKTIALLHTSFVTAQSVVERLCKELMPGVRVINFVDDSLLGDLFAHGKLDEHLVKRVCLQVLGAEDAGADVVLSVCNSVPEAIETAARITTIPVVAIDEGMAELLVERAERIGVVATGWPSAPSLKRTIEKKAALVGKTVTVKTKVIREAFEALKAGDLATHDRLVSEEAHRMAREVEVIALSQGSMARVLPLLEDLDVPVYTSPRLAVERVRDLLIEQIGSEKEAGVLAPAL